MAASIFQRSAIWIRGARNYLGKVAERTNLAATMAERSSSHWGWHIANTARTKGARSALGETHRYFRGIGKPYQGDQFADEALRMKRRAGAIGVMGGAALLINQGGDDDYYWQQRSRYYY